MVTSKIQFRRLMTEALERRQLCAADLGHNFLKPRDVNDDSRVSPVDALLVIDSLNSPRISTQGPQVSGLPAFHDVNDDSRVSPVDALLIIDELNSRSEISPSGTLGPVHMEGRINSTSSGASASLEFEQNGSDTELAIKLRNAPPNSTFAVTLDSLVLGSLTTDSKGRGRLVFGQGDDSSQHVPLPSHLPPLSAQTELIIGDLVRGRLSGVSTENSFNNLASGAPGRLGSNSASNSSEWVAQFAPINSLRRKAELETETAGTLTRSKLAVEIEGAQPGSQFEIKVAQSSLGWVSADDRGKAKVSWSTNPKVGERQLTLAFTIDQSTTIQIGQLQSQFQRVG